MADRSAERKRRRSKTPERSESEDSGVLTRSRSSERKKQKTEKDVKKEKRRSSFVRGRKSMHLLEQQQEQQQQQTIDDTVTNSGGINIQEYTDRLKAESSKWDSLCEEHSAAAENAEKSAKETTSDIPPWESLSAEQQRLLGGKPDLQGILDYTKKCREDLEVYVDKIASTTKTLSAFESTAEAFISAQANELGMKTFKRMEHFNSPMTLISKIVGKTEKS
ncbi:PREDICTED: uncharacterized protein LOC109482483 [Branchiostoma belcheri]|uniref:Uncharacterized protein LOC109482483 n=1 Tax=Branchiostoma belcheri TaxID=7741 RepID=A0A6P5ABQ1_BRABE|nr:PREDICTED: uncharacterized protein LOC109482483 [Branchiostoma belcheri]